MVLGSWQWNHYFNGNCLYFHIIKTGSGFIFYLSAMHSFLLTVPKPSLSLHYHYCNTEHTEITIYRSGTQKWSGMQNFRWEPQQRGQKCWFALCTVGVSQAAEPAAPPCTHTPAISHDEQLSIADPPRGAQGGHFVQCLTPLAARQATYFGFDRKKQKYQ